MPYKDPAQQREAEHRWERRHRAQRRRAQLLRRQEQRKRFDAYKRTLKCARCPERHPATLDFHHRDPKLKDVSLGEVVARKDWSWERVMAEVKKCLVLCSNCHRKHHYRKRRGV